MPPSMRSGFLPETDRWTKPYFDPKDLHYMDPPGIVRQGRELKQELELIRF